MSEQELPYPLTVGRRLSIEVLEPMKLCFVGKDEVIDLLGICLVGGENLFLHGPPGTAKSAIIQELSRRLEGRSFEYLLTRFTEPSELFGPFDIRKLREGELITNTEGMLPESSFCFLDEIFNANSAVLNSLLTVLNERMFRRGRETRRLPLITAVGASNRLPDDEALGALFDRFLLRVHCDNVPDERLSEVLAAGWRYDTNSIERGTTLKLEELRALRDLLPTVRMEAVRPAVMELVLALRRAGLSVSDRRAVKMQRLVAASALLCGRTEPMVSDLWVFRYIWETREQQEVLSSLVQGVVAKQGASVEKTIHPRAQTPDAPQPEVLAQELEQLSAQFTRSLTPPEQATLRDRLGALAARIEWVAADESRAFLQEKLDALWTKVGTAPKES